MSAVRVNVTKITLRNTFIEYLFTLQSEKESTNDSDYQQIFDLAVNPYTASPT